MNWTLRACPCRFLLIVLSFTARFSSACRELPYRLVFDLHLAVPVDTLMELLAKAVTVEVRPRTQLTNYRPEKQDSNDIAGAPRSDSASKGLAPTVAIDPTQRGEDCGQTPHARP
jgi:hypothetical protein